MSETNKKHNINIHIFLNIPILYPPKPGYPLNKMYLYTGQHICTMFMDIVPGCPLNQKYTLYNWIYYDILYLGIPLKPMYIHLYLEFPQTPCVFPSTPGYFPEPTLYL